MAKSTFLFLFFFRLRKRDEERRGKSFNLGREEKKKKKKKKKKVFLNKRIRKLLFKKGGFSATETQRIFEMCKEYA